MALNSNIILCGFMGSGKTTIGKVLAKRIGVPFTDMDRYIENKCNARINQIFEQYGEKYFRKQELEAATDLSANSPCIIASGGGALLNDEVTCTLKKSGKIVLIETPVNVLVQRLSTDKNRPALQHDNREQIIRELYSKRQPLYRSCADVIVDGSGSIGTVVNNIIFALGLYNKKRRCLH